MYQKILDFIKTLLAHRGIKFYGENIIYLALEKMIRLFVGFFVGIYVARELTPKYFGLLNYAMSYVMVFSFFALTFLDSIAIREILNKPADSGKILGSLRLMKIVSVSLMVLSIYLSLNFFDLDKLNRQLILIIAMGYLFQNLQVVDVYFQSQVQSKYIALSQIIAFLIISIIKICLIHFKSSVIYFALVEMLYMLLIFIFYSNFYQLKKIAIKLKVSLDYIKFFLHQSKFLFFGAIFSMIAFRIEFIIMKKFVTPDTLGSYAVAMKVVELFYFVTIIFSSTFFPAITRSKQVSPEHYRHRLNLFCSAIFYINLVCVAILIVASPLIAMLYGKSYSHVALLITLYALRLPLTGLQTALINYLLLENRIKYFTLQNFIYMLSVIISAYLLTQLYGAIGTAISIVISQIIIILVLPLFSSDSRQLISIAKSALFYPSSIIKKYL